MTDSRQHLNSALVEAVALTVFLDGKHFFLAEIFFLLILLDLAAYVVLGALERTNARLRQSLSELRAERLRCSSSEASLDKSSLPS